MEMNIISTIGFPFLRNKDGDQIEQYITIMNQSSRKWSVEGRGKRGTLPNSPPAYTWQSAEAKLLSFVSYFDVVLLVCLFFIMFTSFSNSIKQIHVDFQWIFWWPSKGPEPQWQRLQELWQRLWPRRTRASSSWLRKTMTLDGIGRGGRNKAGCRRGRWNLPSPAGPRRRKSNSSRTWQIPKWGRPKWRGKGFASTMKLIWQTETRMEYMEEGWKEGVCGKDEARVKLGNEITNLTSLRSLLWRFQLIGQLKLWQWDLNFTEPINSMKELKFQWSVYNSTFNITALLR